MTHASLVALLSAVLVTGAGDKQPLGKKNSDGPPLSSYHARVVGTGSVSATVLIEVSNDGSNWLTLGTIVLSGTTSDQDGFAANAAWVWVRARCTAISGTGAALTVKMGTV